LRLRAFSLALEKQAGKGGAVIMSIDTISNFITIIRNGLSVGKRSVRAQNSHLKAEIARVLKDEGYIKDFKIVKEGEKAYVDVMLKYVNGQPAIHELTRISKVGRRQYERLNNLTPVIGGLGISIITTSRGVMTDKQAKNNSVGGEVICHIW
jgi:small subunit ribosomal protein S8